MKEKLRKLKLVLEDGSIFEGESFGAYTETEGEVVFATGMVGYPESFTDPSFNGQILVLTFPLIGNYGVPASEKENGIEKYFESNKVWPRAIVVSEYSEQYNHWEAGKSLSDWLKEHNVPGITGVDTRALTKKIRERGVMLGRVLFPESKAPKQFNDPNKEPLIAQASTTEILKFPAGKKHIALVDTGIKNNIIRSFLKRKVSVSLVPWNHDFKEDKEKYDGYFFSNGPGDPMSVPETHNAMKYALASGKPTYGICMGNQIMAIAVGGKTFKMKYGHRSHNQPCIDNETGRCYITTQNHGFAVDQKSLPKDWEVWFKNANDDTVEGIKHKSKPFAAVQFHPEAMSGPTDTDYIFDKFIDLL